MAESNTTNDELEAVRVVLATLSAFDDDSRERIIRTVGTFYDRRSKASERLVSTESREPGTAAAFFSEDRAMSPKAFLLQKRPITDIDRIACLAYYLTHYRQLPVFGTVDLSKLNTEAAQSKFTNAAYAVGNAVQAGLLAQAAQGQKQISAVGEQFVQTLPDKDAASALLSASRRKKRSRKTKTSQKIGK